MKKASIVLLFLCIFASVYSQKYDLIVTDKGDSIACRIDSITDAAVYIKMKYKGTWVPTYYRKNEVIEYKYDAIKSSRILFKPGTSFIDKVYYDVTDIEKEEELEIGFGLNVLGPGQQMANLMEKYGFDRDFTYYWSGKHTVEYPQFNKVGFTMHFSYNKYIGFRSQVGILLNYSFLNKVEGRSTSSYSEEFLDIVFTSFSLVPLFSFDLGQYCEFSIGPSIMINSGNVTGNSSAEQDYTVVSIGLLNRLNLKIWNNQRSFGEIGTYYLLVGGNKMGPYSTIPESKINFSYLSIFFAYGFKL